MASLVKSSFFILYIISVLTFGTIYVGSFSVRVLMSVMMLGYLFVYYRKEKVVGHIGYEYMKLYIASLLVMGLMLFVNGDIYQYGFLKKIISHYLICGITYYAINLFIHDKKDLVMLSKALVVLILIDSAITILQYHNDPIGWVVGQLFSDISENEEFFENYDSAVGVSITPGIFGHVVNNALNLAVLTPLLFMVVYDKNTSLIYKLLSFLTMLVSIYACALTQQRAAFVLLIFQILSLLYYLAGKRKILLVCITILLPAFIFVGADSFSSMDSDILGRFASTQSESRDFLFEKAFEYISSHFLVGGPMRYTAITGYSAHNIILDSLITGGVFLFCAIMALYIKTIRKSFHIIFEIKSQRNNFHVLVLAESLLCLMIYGLFHNVSYMTGDVIVFILLTLTLKYYKIKDNKI